MRLRSSQFVFLMLLICSVQVPQECAWRLVDGAVANRPDGASQQRAAVSSSSRRLTRLTVEFERLTPAMQLDASARDAHRTPWSMAQPAQESAAIASFTGFLRA